MANATELFALGSQYLQGGDPSRAEELYRQVLQLEPSHVDAWCNLGVACARQGKLDEATAHYQAALRLRPQYAAVHYNLANTLRKNGHNREALAHYQAARGELVNHPGLHLNMGMTLAALGQLDEAIGSFRQSILLQPNTADVYNHLGNALREKGLFDEALANFQRFLQLNPQDPRGYNNIGITLASQGKNEEGKAALLEAIRLRPDYADAHCNLGILLAEQGKLDESIAHLNESVRLKPELLSTHITLGLALAGQGRREEAIASWQHALQLKPDFVGAASNILYALNFDPKISAAELFEAHREWQRRQANVEPLDVPADLDLEPERRLRIGYVSPDFRSHPISYFVLPLLANHDRAQVEAICYSEVRVPDVATAKCKALAHGWRSIYALSDTTVAELIRRDKIDILVDLAGHTNDNRLRVFAYKPAPVQVTYLGYPNTTGLTTIDYRLTDAITDPPGEPLWYTEELIRLAGAFCCVEAPPYTPPVSPSPAAKAGHLTFGSVHNLGKLNPEVLDLWCRVLKAIPTARLIAYRNTLNGSARDRLRDQFMERGIAENRFELRHASKPGRGYLDIYEEVDVLLDTLPWSAHTTACEALFMGVPVLTIYGSRHAGRMAASILTQVGLTDWITRSPEEFVQRALKASTELDRLAALRASLRETMIASPLCDGKKFTCELEEIFRTMWRRYCEQQRY